jgi:hypothetical protein
LLWKLGKAPIFLYRKCVELYVIYYLPYYQSLTVHNFIARSIQTLVEVSLNSPNQELSESVSTMFVARCGVELFTVKKGGLDSMDVWYYHNW